MANCFTGCFIQSPGECVYYSGLPTPYLGVGTDTTFNTFVSVVDSAIQNISQNSHTEIYLLTQTIAFTQADLNNLYGTYPPGTKVICPNLTFGGLVYWKYTVNSWFSLPIAPVP